jgi:hypothetical protein
MHDTAVHSDHHGMSGTLGYCADVPYDRHCAEMPPDRNLTLEKTLGLTKGSCVGALASVQRRVGNRPQCRLQLYSLWICFLNCSCQCLTL